MDNDNILFKKVDSPELQRVMKLFEEEELKI